MYSNVSSQRQALRRTLMLVVALFAALSGVLGAAPPLATAAAPNDMQAAARSHALLAPPDVPVPAPAAIGTGRFRYFPQTGHFLRGLFFQFWETHGATSVLGLPITEALVEDGLTVQYLERARLEWHPEFGGTKNEVLVTRLGAVLTGMRGITFAPQPAPSNAPNSYFFVETGHNLSNAFLAFWQRNGGLAVFGYPISEEVLEINPADGRTYTVQYFERNRFEWHPEARPQDNVLLGLLGVEYARLMNLNPLARILLPGPLDGGDLDLSDAARLAELVEADLLPAVQALGRTVQFRWVPAVIIQNNISVEFSDFDEEGVAGAFVTTRSRTTPYLILVPEGQRGASVAALASVLAHEATHGYDVVTGALTGRTGCSVEAEVRAYMNGLAAWWLLKGPNALTETFESNTLDAQVSRSLRRFNEGNTTLVFDFDVQHGREFIRGLYGDDCGA